MVDRINDEFRNGPRSRGASPINNFSDDSSSGDDSSDDNGMRIGEEYQALIPDFDPDAKSESRHKAMIVWSPNSTLSETKLDEYLRIAKEMYGYNMEQALGMLYWHDHNVEKSLADLPNYTPFPDEWTIEDKVLFEQAFGFHGKSFHRIRQMLPDKTISGLVKYYYSWKKLRSRTSVMDRAADGKLGLRENSEDSSPSDSDMETESKEKTSGKQVLEKSESTEEHQKEAASEEQEKTEKEGEEVIKKGNCSNCSASASQLHSTPKGSLCNSCYQYWRRTGLMRSIIGARKSEHAVPMMRHNPVKLRRKPPRGMYLTKEDLHIMTTGPPGQTEALLRQLESEVVAMKTQAQYNKQVISSQKQTLSSGIDHLRSPESSNRSVHRWTNEELLLAVQGVRRYGKDFRAIAETIGNKSEAHVRNFFVNYGRRYNLDEVLQEYEAEYGPTEKNDGLEENSNGKVAEKEEKMEVETAQTTIAPTQTSSAAVTTTVQEGKPKDTLVVTTPSAPPPLKPSQPANVKSGPPPLQQTQQQPRQHHHHHHHGHHHHHHARMHLLPPRLQQPPPLVKPANETAVPSESTQ